MLVRLGSITTCALTFVVDNTVKLRNSLLGICFQYCLIAWFAPPPHLTASIVFVSSFCYLVVHCDH